MFIRCLLLLTLLGCLSAFSAELSRKIEIGKNADLTLTGDNTVIVVEHLGIAVSVSLFGLVVVLLKKLFVILGLFGSLVLFHFGSPLLK